jgi:putative endonuclease
MSRRDKIIGQWGEDQACAFLQRHGFFIRERNFYSTVGELDIIACKDDDYYFVEVKTRTKNELATDLSITATKKYKMQKTVRKYCYVRSLVPAGLLLCGLLVIYEKFSKIVTFRMVIFD